jgi:hypothetical protein
MRCRLIPLMAVSVFTLAAGCSDNDDGGDVPSDGTSSGEVLGGSAVPGGSMPEVMNAPANPEAPLDPVGGDGSGSQP